MKEFTLRATLVGLFFGFLFAIANGYLALKIGQTISASIPAATMAIATTKHFFKRGTILENNLIQTIASLGEAVASGVVYIVPALILLNATPTIGQIFQLSALGSILGILLMIPMRRFLIVKEHLKLPYPEGTACAEILKAGERGHFSTLLILKGFSIAGGYRVLTNIAFLWHENIAYTIQNFRFTLDCSPALLGVGYIIGARITAIMFAGGAFAWWILIPLIMQIDASQTSIDLVWKNYVRYIGAGALATGGLLSLFTIIPHLYTSVHTGVKELFSGFRSQRHIPRTSRDMPMGALVLGVMAVATILLFSPHTVFQPLTILLIIALGILFVAVTSITVGIVGSTTNPISGMLIMTLLIICTLFSFVGWTERVYLIAAITMSCVASCTISVAAATAQNLKTGHLVGATPKYQQIAELIGIFIPALTLGFTIFLLHKTYHIGSELLPAPQASLMAMVAEGVLSGNLPFLLFAIGAILGLILSILRIPALAFALGVYLPLSLTTATMLGGLMSRKGIRDQNGVLFSAGFIEGDACTEILIALGVITQVLPAERPALLPDWSAVPVFFLLALAIRRLSSSSNS